MVRSSLCSLYLLVEMLSCVCGLHRVWLKLWKHWFCVWELHGISCWRSVTSRQTLWQLLTPVSNITWQFLLSHVTSETRLIFTPGTRLYVKLRWSVKNWSLITMAKTFLDQHLMKRLAKLLLFTQLSTYLTRWQNRFVPLPVGGFYTLEIIRLTSG